MPDNISLTVADINQIKNSQNAAYKNLENKTFIFDEDISTTDFIAMPLIPGSANEARGLMMYAGKSQLISLKGKTEHTVDFDLSKVSFSSQTLPVVVATLSGTKSLNNETITLWTETAGTKTTVHIKPQKKITGNTQVRVHLIAIGYA